MDGTILDKFYDDYFWEIYVPQKYAEKEGISFDEAQKKYSFLCTKQRKALLTGQI